jgi:hypothetical protein
MSTTHRLGDLAIALRGTVPANTVPDPDGPRFFGIAEITARGTSSPRYVEPGTEVRDPVVLAEGDVVMALLGNIGDATVISDDASDALLGRECVALRVMSPDVLRPAWLCAWMSSGEFEFQVAQNTRGSTMPRLPIGALEDFTVTVPPIDRQLEIEGLVQRFDAAIAVTATNLEQVKSLRDAELQLAMASNEERP